MLDWTAIREVSGMPKKRYTPEEIIQHLRTVELDTGKGLAVLDSCREHRVCRIHVGRGSRPTRFSRALRPGRARPHSLLNPLPLRSILSSMTPPPFDRSQPLQDLETDAALRAILEGTATETGQQFFAALVQNLAKALSTHGAWVTEYFPERRRLRALAFWMDGQWIKDYDVDITGAPCEQVIDTQRLVHFPDRLLDLYP